ncbi:hypothetical protein FKW77_009199 [Venturia effusa]|uniref:Uncharacterized protein n=1 Tax=Venturia effusa TaxID=50376 RepID=A0A517KX70_9PEZI|nr:hypothetical protein FKW77_009199 [Venturia effusa]
MSASQTSVYVPNHFWGKNIFDLHPPPPSRILPPSQLARNYRTQTSGIEDRATCWWDMDDAEPIFDSFARSRDTKAPKPNSSFWKRFAELPGEVRNQIHDELFETDTDLFTVSFGLHLGKSYHAEAVYSGTHRIPLGLFYQQDLETDFLNEIIDRWCATVKFHLVESFELNIKRPWPNLRAPAHKSSSLHLKRYLDPAADHIIPQLRGTIWFPRMRRCYLKLNLFCLRSLMKHDKRGRENLGSCLSEIGVVLKQAKALTDLRIDVVLWPQKMPSMKERERPKFINTDDLNYRWDSSDKDNLASFLETCFAPLKEVPGIRTLRIYGVNLIDAWWSAEEPDNFQYRIPSHLPASSSQRHFIPAM